MPRALWLLAILLGLALGAGAQAHEVRPGYLELQQTGPETWDVLWKVPARGDLQLAIAPAWPDNCGVEGAPRRFATGGAATERSTIRCAGGLTGRAIAVSGLSATVVDVLARVQRSDGTTQVVRLIPAAPVFVVEDAPRWTTVAATYLGLGVEHILLGVDHLLFVLAMLLLVRSWRRLVATITAFTVAHSITLALATLGFVHVPPQPVEAAIALSIVFVAAEIVHGRMGRTGLTERWPWVVAFVFGLLHGLGFAERAARGRPAGERDPDRLAVLQSRGGAGPARLRRRGPGASRVTSISATVRAGMELAPRRPTASARWRCTGPLSA